MVPWRAAALVVAAALAQQTGSPAPAPATVRIDVVATDAAGRPVESLGPADFELRENGVVQALDEVSFVKANGPAPARVLAIFLDDFHVPPASTEAVRSAVEHLLDTLRADDQVIVMKPLDSVLTIRPMRDRAAMHEAVSAFEGRMGDVAPRTAFEHDFMSATPARVSQMRAQVVTSALGALAAHLGSLGPGRKSVLLVSDGFEAARRGRGMEPLPTIDSVIRTANRHNVSIYTMTPAGIDADADVAAGAVLKRLAEETAGRATSLNADAESQMLRDAGGYYLLAYRSAQVDDGRFRQVDVKVRPRNVVLRARQGYWSLFPDEALALKIATEGPPPKPKLPDGFDQPLHTSPLVKPWFGVTRGDGDNVRVTFVWEPTPKIPGDRTRRREPAHVALTVLGADGARVFSGDVEPANASFPSAGADARPRAVFDVPPGRVRMRMDIQDGAGQSIDTDLREIAIRALPAPLALGTPAILRARTALEFRALDDDWTAPPLASRDFLRTDRLLVRVTAYGTQGANPVSARLLNRRSQQMQSLTMRPSPDDEGMFQCDLPLAPFASSEYIIEVTATDGRAQTKEIVNFRIVG